MTLGGRALPLFENESGCFTIIMLLVSYFRKLQSKSLLFECFAFCNDLIGVRKK
jgi:hypothetical protein